jgi:hypothetical protein
MFHFFFEETGGACAPTGIINKMKKKTQQG